MVDSNLNDINSNSNYEHLTDNDIQWLVDFEKQDDENEIKAALKAIDTVEAAVRSGKIEEGTFSSEEEVEEVVDSITVEILDNIYDSEEHSRDEQKSLDMMEHILECKTCMKKYKIFGGDI